MINDSLPVEKLDGEFNLCFSDNFIKDDNDILTEKTLCTVLCNLSEDYKEKYKDKVVFIKDIPVEKQHEFVECFKTNDKDTINTTLEIIMNDYSKDRTEIIHSHPIIVEDNNFNDNTMELVNYNYHYYLKENEYFDIKKYGKNRHHTTKQQPNKKSKKSARRNNRRAKRNNR